MSKIASETSNNPEHCIAYQGEAGAFSYHACKEAFPDMVPIASPTFEEAIAKVRNREARLAMLPIENSIYGRVADIHHLLPESGLFVIQEHFLPIDLALLAVPNTPLDQIKEAQSLDVALGQCRRFLRDHDITAIAGPDTAGSARLVAKKGNPARAAIAPEIAGEIYGLDIVARKIQDAAHNTTRFLVVSRQRIEAEVDHGPVLTSFVFRTRNMPAALYKALGGFATNGVNMIRLESYMLNGSFTATQFIADIEGHRDSPDVALALEELQFFTDDLKILGVYPAHPLRQR